MDNQTEVEATVVTAAVAPTPIRIDTERIPIYIWARESDLDGYDNAIGQAKNLANHPLARRHVALMPDFHLGYGMPIGGVFATKGGVVPNAVGVDIGCGMIAMKTEIEAASLSKDVLQEIRQTIHAHVPVGFNVHKEAQQLGPKLALDELFTTENERAVVRKNLTGAALQIGTLGGGNHFIELQKDEDGYLWLMIHSGSRGIGKKVCDHYDDIAIKYMQQFHSQLPPSEGKKPDLAFLPEGVPEYRQYLAEMQWCCDYAEESRIRMLIETMEAVESVTRQTIDRDQLPIQTHHNYAAMENHMGDNLLVHRKGAVKADGLVIIPGSMGTASYIGRGLNQVLAFKTCSHGAGRVMGRKEANRTITKEQAVESMKDVVFGIRDGDYEEMPAAYKDVDRVMENQAALVQPEHRLIPLAVVKG